jgi:arylsulfatase A-like enzyme
MKICRFTCLLWAFAVLAAAAGPPNIIWVIAEDSSPHIGVYGETVIATPNLDRMAAEGVKFETAFVTNPVCSPSRSAMVSGMYQTTLGAHNHRSQNVDPKAGGNKAYYDSYRVPESIKLIPELFAEAGYYVVNAGKGKQDYNFIARTELYQSKDWAGRAGGQPFFAQVQLAGGKNRRAQVAKMTDPAKVKLPPYYPDNPVMREDWAQYLNSWVATDNAMGELFARLEQEGTLDNTVVFFWTDHGISHVRGKQFLYDEGIRVPLIVRFPDKQHAGTVRKDLVNQIDVAAASLALAGIEIPDSVQGRPLFASEHQEREYIFAARDRCDETVDTIRAVRTERYKYIRNFRYFRPHTQPSRYKDGKLITKTMRSLHSAGKLSELQDRVFAERRPVEELYDLQADPQETVNLAANPEHRATLEKLRAVLYEWMAESRDMGIVPEPVLEDLGRKYGSKYDAMRHADQKGLTAGLISIADAGAREDVAKLQPALSSSRPSIRYWAAMGLGNTQRVEDARLLRPLFKDADGAVRVAAARGLAMYGDEAAVQLLAREIDNENLLVGLYAIRAIEELGEKARAAGTAVWKARKSAYDGTRRVADRLSEQWELEPTS